MPFRWTINPYRGCTHGCVYCFARQTHSYLDLDTGADFDAEIVVKVNVAEVLAREVGRPSWGHEAVALGTNTDPYQRAEGRYRLMPGIIEALAGSGTPFSILTKGTTLRRDLPLLAEAATRTPVMMGVSLALLDETVHETLEPGTPSPRARLELVRAIRAAGLPCQVLIAPVLPMLTDGDDDLERVIAAVAEAGATSASVMALHLRPGAREWFLRWLGEQHPELVEPYARALPRRVVRAAVVRDRPARAHAPAAAPPRPGPAVGLAAARTRRARSASGPGAPRARRRGGSPNGARAGSSRGRRSRRGPCSRSRGRRRPAGRAPPA